MTFDDLTPEQRDRLIAEKVLGYETGDMPSGTVMMWNESGFMAEIPRYSENMSDAWKALVYRHGRLNYAGDTTRTQLQILLEDRVGADWRDILENMNAYVLCQVMLQAVGMVDAQGNMKEEGDN